MGGGRSLWPQDLSALPKERADRLDVESWKGGESRPGGQDILCRRRCRVEAPGLILDDGAIGVLAS